MKTRLLLLTAAVLAGSAMARAEGEATLEPLQTPDLFAPISPASPAPAETPAVTPAPSESTSTTKAPEALKQGTAEQLRQAVRIRELKTVMQEDPEVQGWRAKAACTKTEEGRRVAMRNYYTVLYTKIEKLDPTLFPVLEGQLHDLLASYEQHSIRPSVLIEVITPLPGSRSEDHATLAGQKEVTTEKQIKIKSFHR